MNIIIYFNDIVYMYIYFTVVYQRRLCLYKSVCVKIMSQNFNTLIDLDKGGVFYQYESPECHEVYNVPIIIIIKYNMADTG